MWTWQCKLMLIAPTSSQASLNLIPQCGLCSKSSHLKQPSSAPGRSYHKSGETAAVSLLPRRMLISSDSAVDRTVGVESKWAAPPPPKKNNTIGRFSKCAKNGMHTFNAQSPPEAVVIKMGSKGGSWVTLLKSNSVHSGRMVGSANHLAFCTDLSLNPDKSFFSLNLPKP